MRYCTLLILLLAVCVQAQQPRVGVDETRPLRLTISDTIRMALEHNREIELERVNVQQVESDLLSAKGSYDPVFTLSTGFTRQVIPVTNALGGGNGKITTETFSQDLQVRGMLTSGAVYNLFASHQRVDTDNFFANLNPLTSTQLGAELRQPLLRNRAVDSVRRRIVVTSRQLDISDLQFRQRVIEVVTRVQRAYWDLVYARRNVEVAEESLELARVQLARAKRLVEAGSQAAIDLVQVEAQLRVREESLLVALEGVTVAENSLKLQILPERSAPEWSQTIIPVDKPQMREMALDLDTLVKTALENRPELKQLELKREIADEDIRFLANQTRPQLDLVAAYTLSGAAGNLVNRPNPFTSQNQALYARINEISALLNLSPIPLPPQGSVPDFLQGGLGQSLSNLFQNRFNTLRIGLQLELPYRNRNIQGQLGKAQYERRKNLTQRQYQEELIESEVRNALQAVRTSQQRIRATEAAVLSAQQQLESEQRRYEAGLSTNFLVLTRQQELAEARGRNLRAQTDYDKALTELQRATGMTLAANSLVVRSPKD